MKIKNTLLSLFLVLSLSAASYGQEDLNIFGYYQVNYTNFNTVVNGKKSMDVNSFLMQQMNIFFQKNFSPELSSFINLEFTNSFSFQDTIGGLKIEEAWLKYSPASYFNLKAGVLIPRFNNFNEIKNRTVLLPYIYRPIAYETYFFKQFGTDEFVPTSANLQIYGDIPVVDQLRLNYAGFYGNSETSMLNNNRNFWGPGQDPTKYKMVGGRVGIEYGDLQLGGSFTYDRVNLDKSYNGWQLAELNLGYVPRTRLGAYLNYALYGFELEAEMIKVTYDLSPANKDSLRAMGPFTTQNFDKTYYHAALLYNISDKLGAYASYDYLEGKDNIFIASGMDAYTGGACYRVNNSVILKAQYSHHVVNMSGMPVTRNDYLLGASISF